MQPVLPPGAGIYLHAFYELLTDRYPGEGKRPIPFSSIDRYARRYGFNDPDDFSLLLDLIRALEAEHTTLLKSISPTQEPPT